MNFYLNVSYFCSALYYYMDIRQYSWVLINDAIRYKMHATQTDLLGN